MGNNTITIAHGAGGRISHDLIKDVFFSAFNNDLLNEAGDSAQVDIEGCGIAFTTDSFVIHPLFFPGGDIGKIAVCGTVNDLAVAGSSPKYISCAVIIEEGFSISDLKKIAASIKKWSDLAGVKVITGDTKVVEKGEADGIFINTSGIGLLKRESVLGRDKIQPGDEVIITGTMGDHGIAIMTKRKGLELDVPVDSDCAPLNIMLEKVLDCTDGVRFMRDPTRGGLATTLNEITEKACFGISVEEEKIPVKEEVRAGCEILGLDPVYLANEGKAIIIASPGSSEKILEVLRDNEYGVDSELIGEVTKENPGKVCLKTRYGVARILDMLTSEPLPRIC